MHIHTFIHIMYVSSYTSTYTSSTAQGGGGSFRLGNLKESLVVVNHGRQSESTDGLKGGWSCVFGVLTTVAVATWSVTSPTTAACSVV